VAYDHGLSILIFACWLTH